MKYHGAEGCSDRARCRGYRALARVAGKKGLTIKDALREAVLRWTSEESGISPKDPIFDIALSRRKAQDWGKGLREYQSIMTGSSIGILS